MQLLLDRPVEPVSLMNTSESLLSDLLCVFGGQLTERAVPSRESECFVLGYETATTA